MWYEKFCPSVFRVSYIISMVKTYFERLLYKNRYCLFDLVFEAPVILT